ncbi:MAG: 50S ribosomal protein L44e [Candidatus Micrarchaeota archaeon]|nr:MAG: 50S ribosomal protein L44e [Candidatus Micrarchaeota archaeon]
MEMPKEISAYCPKCGKHTIHTVSLYNKKPESGLSKGTRKHNRKLKGYVGKVKGEATKYKVSKKQKVLLKCKECGYIVERVVGSRTRKKLTIKAEA